MSKPNLKPDEDPTFKEAFDNLAAYSASSRAIMEQAKKLNAQAFRQQTDERIAQLESEILALKIHRNMAADTSLLPPEILSKIFLILSRSIEYGKYASSWIRVTHVCRHWRAIALDCPALWSNLVFVNKDPTLTEVMLQRSKDAPLSLKFISGFNSTTFADILCKIASQTNRLHDVELCSISKDTLPKILSRFETTAPILTKLVLEGSIDYWSGSEIDVDHLPQDLLKGGAPSLQHLTLTLFEIHWDMLPLSSTLTHLQLDNLREEVRPPQQLFLESLEKMSRLETLKLSRCLPNVDNASHPGTLPITLPSLKNLELRDDVKHLFQFFCRVRVPQTAAVDFDLRETQQVSEDLRSLFSALRASWILSEDIESGSRADPIHPEVFQIVDGTPGFEPQLMCWLQGHVILTTSSLKPPPNLTVTGSSLLFRNITTIAGCFDISSLRSLRIASSFFTTEKEFFSPFANLPKLEELAIWDSLQCLSAFLMALTKQLDNSPLFPALRSINLKRIDFDQERYRVSGTDVHALVVGLKKCPALEKFTIEDCLNFTEEHWETVCRALPASVEKQWDHHVEVLSDDEEEDYDDYSADYDSYHEYL